ncbi:MAG: winged helix domain-containing protein, partial [Usitatibacter sp.]
VPQGHYADPGAAPATHPGELPEALVKHAAEVLARVRWTEGEVLEFAGRFLSEPKAEAVFTAPRRPLSRAQFAARAARRGLALDPKSRLLFSGTMFFINGESAAVPAQAQSWMRRLADEREISGPAKAPAPFWDIAHSWYLLGFLEPQGEEK